MYEKSAPGKQNTRSHFLLFGPPPIMSVEVWAASIGPLTAGPELRLGKYPCQRLGQSFRHALKNFFAGFRRRRS
jgi:hypothetical protein